MKLTLKIGWSILYEFPFESMSFRSAVDAKDVATVVIPARYYDMLKRSVRYQAPLRIYQGNKILSFTYCTSMRFDETPARKIMTVEGIHPGLWFGVTVYTTPIAPIRRTLANGKLTFEFSEILPNVRRYQLLTVGADKIWVNSVSSVASPIKQRMIVTEQ